MIDFDAPNFESNAKILLEGMNYIGLPDVIDWNTLGSHLRDVIGKMDDKEYDFYAYDDQGFINGFKSIVSPDYIRSPGVEAITFYTFKKDGSFREMQIPNLLHYCAFIYNSLYVFDDIFEVLYLDAENDKYVSHSNSYVVIGKNFVIPSGYGIEEELEEGVFITDNNKVQGRISFGENRRRYNRCQDTFLYSVKIDIESFFPNLYTHYFEKIADYEPYKTLQFDKKYFSFLDLFHQRINNNQTKGIPAGLFSSHIAAELLMLCVDWEISDKIKEQDMGYIRYVDDMVFFSDSKQQLESIVSEVQRIIGKYRLRINGTKTEHCSNVLHLANQANLAEIYKQFSFLKMEKGISLDENDFYNFKEYISELLDSAKIAQLKTVLTLLLNCLQQDKIVLDVESDCWFCYLVTLVFEEVNLVCHVYRLLDCIISKAAETLKKDYVKKLQKKTSLIEDRYCDTLFQIWHYYVMTRYAESELRMECLEKYIEKCDLNPIILCMFVEDGYEKNKRLLKIITEQFESESTGGDWRQRIMFSRWWLPLMKVRMVDSYNYYGFMQSSYFPQVITDLI